MEKIKITDREWKEFFISALFDKPKRGKRILNKNHVEGNTPLVSSIGYDNGVSNFIGNTEKVRLYENCLTIANGGSSAGLCYYLPFEFIASDHVTHCKGEYSEYEYLALASLITSKLTEKYSFSREISDKRIAREKIMLPVDKKGELDFLFLSELIQQIKLEHQDNVNKRIEKKLASIKYKKIPNLNEKEWDGFFIGGDEGIFELRASKSGIDKNKLLDNAEENIPYITRTDMNNGLSGFVGEKQKHGFNIDPGNVISVGLDTQTAFYQKHCFYTGQNVQVISNEYINEYNGLFIAHLIKKQIQKLNWGGTGATLGRLERTKILLPVDKQGEPDYK